MSGFKKSDSSPPGFSSLFLFHFIQFPDLPDCTAICPASKALSFPTPPPSLDSCVFVALCDLRAPEAEDFYWNRALFFIILNFYKEVSPPLLFFISHCLLSCALCVFILDDILSTEESGKVFWKSTLILTRDENLNFSQSLLFVKKFWLVVEIRDHFFAHFILNWIKSSLLFIVRFCKRCFGVPIGILVS